MPYLYLTENDLELLQGMLDEDRDERTPRNLSSEDAWGIGPDMDDIVIARVKDNRGIRSMRSYGAIYVPTEGDDPFPLASPADNSDGQIPKNIVRPVECIPYQINETTGELERIEPGTGTPTDTIKVINISPKHMGQQWFLAARIPSLSTTDGPRYVAIGAASPWTFLIGILKEPLYPAYRSQIGLGAWQAQSLLIEPTRALVDVQTFDSNGDMVDAGWDEYVTCYFADRGRFGYAYETLEPVPAGTLIIAYRVANQGASIAASYDEGAAGATGTGDPEFDTGTGQAGDVVNHTWVAFGADRGATTV